MKPIAIPVVALGAGAHTEDETLDYVQMPSDMRTYQPPTLPEPDTMARCPGAQRTLQAVLAQLALAIDTGRTGAQVPLMNLPAADLRVINQMLGEGEASAVVDGLDGGLQLRIQESVFAGIWRVITWRGDERIDDVIEVGPVPQALRRVAEADADSSLRPWHGALPPQVQNAPMLVDEIHDQVRRWRPGDTPYVVNLSLLPVTPEDIGFLDHRIGTGRVLLLSRGYGNCRITNARLPNCWRVVYYNSMDKVILNTVEVVDMPEIAMAATEDLRDAHERLLDLVRYLETA
ncbi:MAG: hydrogenase expression/formation protein [Hydrogenophaga sp.]|uniref:hydrogenase expression/formation protein n=1 Tax=Hydrogenophaga sp. TaxID=1904254 RepID=UPI001DA1C2F8|nr:hydrogenase expression/formation protein [Hydrogenophaga sp.]MBX3609048.1 hydrogenase expression/formation protein [Hydrogenophaga sp.]